MPRIITKIEAPAPIAPALIPTAAYARVSGGRDAQLHSLSSQVSYYSDYIQRHGNWEYKGVFTDEAYTGTRDTRKGLQALLEECRAGNVKQIITKSISRFARNTVDLLSIAREMRSIGVGIYFEEQRIDTMSGDGELMLAILASYAQEESRAASENCLWRIQKRFEQGELVGWSFMYGYDIKSGVVTINEEQAAVVRRIFDLYLGGLGTLKIANTLNAEGIPAYYGGRWSARGISSLLKNEKVTGSAVLQKKFTESHLTKRRVINRGEKEQYIAEDTHPAIIEKADFDRVQEIMAKRASRAKAKSTANPRYPYTGKITCGNCGKLYKRKKGVGVFYWQCGTYLTEGKDVCSAKQIPERVLDGFAAELGGMGNIEEIVVPAHGRLIFKLNSGAEVMREWHITRRDSWTDEMKQAARQRRLEQEAAKHGK
jgi:DNA invertase Pin-like site-specific DNA recombinase